MTDKSTGSNAPGERKMLLEDVVAAIRQKRIGYRMKNMPEQPLRVVLSFDGYCEVRADSLSLRYVEMREHMDGVSTIYGVPFTTEPDQTEPFRIVEG
jgi:hypothetical protein